MKWGRPVEDVLDSMTMPQMREAMAFWELEPFGDEWRQATLIAAVLINQNRKKGSKAIQPDELLPIPKREKKQTGRDMLSVMKAWAAAQNGRK